MMDIRQILEQSRKDNLLQTALETAIEQNDSLLAENEALRKLAHDYITAYEKLAFGDALLTGEQDA